MGIWFPSVPLADGEIVQFQAAANSFLGHRSVGGQVTLTNQRVIFVPNRLDGMTGGSRREMPLPNIQSVQRLEPGAEAVKQRGLAAAIHPQLEINDGSGSPLIVTVSNLDELARLLPN